MPISPAPLYPHSQHPPLFVAANFLFFQHSRFSTRLFFQHSCFFTSPKVRYYYYGWGGLRFIEISFFSHTLNSILLISFHHSNDCTVYIGKFTFPFALPISILFKSLTLYNILCKYQYHSACNYS